MQILFFAIPLAILAIWIGSIRPYCLRNREGYTPGATWGITVWVDWQQATEIAKRNNDSGMVLTCRVFLALHIAASIGFLLIAFRGC